MRRYSVIASRSRIEPVRAVPPVSARAVSSPARHMAVEYASRGMLGDVPTKGWIGFWLRRAGRAGGDASTPVNLLFVHVTHCFSGEGHARHFRYLTLPRGGHAPPILVVVGGLSRAVAITRSFLNYGGVTDSPKRAKRHPNPGGDSPCERELG